MSEGTAIREVQENRKDIHLNQSIFSFKKWNIVLLF